MLRDKRGVRGDCLPPPPKKSGNDRYCWNRDSRRFIRAPAARHLTSAVLGIISVAKGHAQCIGIGQGVDGIFTAIVVFVHHIYFKTHFSLKITMVTSQSFFVLSNVEPAFLASYTMKCS